MTNNNPRNMTLAWYKMGFCKNIARVVCVCYKFTTDTMCS